jgi:MFS family permease
MGFQFQSVAALAPLLARDLGLDKSQLGWLIGLYLLPGVAFALPGGLLGRRFGDKRMVAAGLLLMALGGIGLALATSFAQANAARFVSGIGAVMLNVLVSMMVADAFDGKERLLAMAVMINAWPIGIGLALLVLGPLGQHAGWPSGFVASALFAAIGLAFVAALHRQPGAAGVPAEPAPAHRLDRGTWHLLLVGSLPWLLYNAAYQIVLSFLPSFFVDHGHGIAAAGSLVALNTMLFVVSVQVGGILLRRARRPDRLCHLALGGWCATLIALAAGGDPLTWMVIGGLLGGLPAAALVSLPAEILRPESRNFGMGVFYPVSSLGCAVRPAIAGALYDRSGGSAALAMATLLGLACMGTLWSFRRALASANAAREAARIAS